MSILFKDFHHGLLAYEARPGGSIRGLRLTRVRRVPLASEARSLHTRRG